MQFAKKMQGYSSMVLGIEIKIMEGSTKRGKSGHGNSS